MKKNNKKGAPVVPGMPFHISVPEPKKKVKRKINNSILIWVALIFYVLVCIAAEYLLKVSGYRFGDCPFWNCIAIPFHREIKANLMELYISQISTTFLVTTFLSFLSDNKEPVYWTTLVEYKLINPQGKSLKDITWYCLGCLVTSFIALMLQATLAFLFSFVFSIIGLSVITCRMMCIFFAKEQIKDELRREFMNLTPQQQKDRLIRLEENLISAVGNRDVAYIRDDLKFLEFVNLPVADEIVMHFLKILPNELYTLRLESAKLLTNVTSDVQFAKMKNREYLEGTVVGQDADIIIPRHEQDKIEQKNEWFKHALYAYVFNFLQEDIRDGLLFTTERNELLVVHECLNIHRFKDHIGMLMHTNSNKVFAYGELDFKQHFTNNLQLLKQAYSAKTDVLPYVEAIQNLQYLFTFGILLVRYSMHDTNSNYHQANKDSLTDADRVMIPPSYEDAAVYYAWEDTCAVFDAICALPLPELKKELFDFLVQVAAHTDSITREQADALLEKVNGISVKADEYRFVLNFKEACIGSLHAHFSQRREREKFLNKA